MERWVEITFDCIPLRSVGDVTVPDDASPRFRQLCERLLAASERHGSHNTYFLHRASCTYHLLNDADRGWLKFRFEGTLFTDEADEQTRSSELTVELDGETCSWVTEPVVSWFQETVQRAVECEFDRYIAAGDLERTKQRVADMQAASDEAGGFLGMYL